MSTVFITKAGVSQAEVASLCEDLQSSIQKGDKDTRMASLKALNNLDLKGH